MKDENKVCVLRTLLPIILIPLLLTSKVVPVLERSGTEESSEIHYM